MLKNVKNKQQNSKNGTRNKTLVRNLWGASEDMFWWSILSDQNLFLSCVNDLILGTGKKTKKEVKEFFN